MSRPRPALLAALVSATAALVACSDDRTIPVDPCEPATYNAAACEAAINANGYYYMGSWHPVYYRYPFSYYSSHYITYIGTGGRVAPRSTDFYSRTYSPSSGGSAFSGSSGTVRGGFGGTAAARASSFGGGSFGG